MKALVIAQVNLVRAIRDRRSLFFLLALPMILIVVLGLIYGGSGTGRVGIVDADRSSLSQGLVAAVRQSDLHIELRTYGSDAELRDAVERGYVEVGISIPAGYDTALRSGATASLTYVAQPTSVAGVVRTAVDQAIGRQSAVIAAARAAAAANGIPFDRAYAVALEQLPSTPGVRTSVESVGDPAVDVSGFTLGAQSQLILFMFLTSLTAATQLILSRQLGVSRRMFSTPTSAATIIAGEALGRFLLALSQGVFIVGVSAVLFGVDWADPLATAVVVVAFALVATGAAMLIGSVASNTSQAASLAPGIGMLLGLLGGTMVPPEIFPPVMQTLSHVTPHAWALDAFRQLVLRGGGLAAVLPDVGVLLLFAAVLLTLSVARFRRVLVAGGA